MVAKSTHPHYGAVAMSLHWVTFAVLIGAYACINLTEVHSEGSGMRESGRYADARLAYAQRGRYADSLFFWAFCLRCWLKKKILCTS
jgi:hypothetical protein